MFSVIAARYLPFPCFNLCSTPIGLEPSPKKELYLSLRFFSEGIGENVTFVYRVLHFFDYANILRCLGALVCDRRLH